MILKINIIIYIELSSFVEILSYEVWFFPGGNKRVNHKFKYLAFVLRITRAGITQTHLQEHNERNENVQCKFKIELVLIKVCMFS